MAAFVVDRKVAVGAAVGGFVSILTWCVSQFAGVVVPAEVGIGATTLLTFIAQWAVPNIREEAEKLPDPVKQ
jgi:hypothetical protein